MRQTSYLQWAIENTKMVWWHDSAELAELDRGIERGAVGATTNPFLANLALSQHKDEWSGQIASVLSRNPEPEEKAKSLMQIAITHAAGRLEPQYEKSAGRMGYVCAQVNPARAADRECMLPMARRFHAWAPNIAVKLPATAAGLDVLEDCTAEGITATLTISYTVPQVIAIAERHHLGIQRARQNGVEPGRCFAVIMIGRLDDYLRDVAHDRRANISESDIRQAGLAVSKRAYSIYRQRGYEATLIVAALRGTYHMTELAGAEIIMSIAPPYQEMLISEKLPRAERIDCVIPADVVERLSTLPEFVKAYEPDGMAPEDFIAYGVTQKTLAQFHEGGWKLLENFR
ncbi:MAG: transaldolase family protein [Phycisphaerales bacterium]|nr:MAG: transaldolase family protein [Phycisphaerales bacterium]